MKGGFAMESEYTKYEPIFGAWKIVKLIGEGSYGKVYEIEREDFGVTYKAALKAITIPRNKSEVKSIISEGMDEESAYTYFRGFVEEFTKEFSLMDKLKGNSYIVNYEDHAVKEHDGEIGWDVLIRMELLTPLNDYLRSHTMQCKDVAQLGIDLCKALEICDKYNIIHRDIKPENIFVSELGNYKLGDFGIARVAEKTTGASTKIGTNSYMAPEVVRGETYDARVDIYSLGLVLYRLLNNNRLPFLPPAPEPVTFTQREEANAKRIKGEVLPNPVNSDERFSEIIRKATSATVSDRYSNATEMRNDLERYLGIYSEPIQNHVIEEPVINKIEIEEECEKTEISPNVKQVVVEEKTTDQSGEHNALENTQSWVKIAFSLKPVKRGIITLLCTLLVMMIITYVADWFSRELRFYSDYVIPLLMIETVIGVGIITIIGSSSWGIIASFLFELVPIMIPFSETIHHHRFFSAMMKQFNHYFSKSFILIPIVGIVVSVISGIIKFRIVNKKNKG